MGKENTNSKNLVIEEYFTNLEENKGKVNHYEEIFNPKEENIDLQTEVTDDEIKLISTLKTFDDFLISKEIKPVYNNYVNFFLRLKISKDRKSRGEYVDVNKNKQDDEELNKRFANLKLG